MRTPGVVEMSVCLCPLKVTVLLDVGIRDKVDGRKRLGSEYQVSISNFGFRLKLVT